MGSVTDSVDCSAGSLLLQHRSSKVRMKAINSDFLKPERDLGF